MGSIESGAGCPIRVAALFQSLIVQAERDAKLIQAKELKIRSPSCTNWFTTSVSVANVRSTAPWLIASTGHFR